MPFKYKPKDTSKCRKTFSMQTMQSAVGEVKGGASIRKTAIKYGIDRVTLMRYSKNEEKFRKIEETGSQYKGKQIFTTAEEKLLVNYLLQCSKMHYGLTRKQAMTLAVDYAIANSKNVPKNWTANNSTGKDWFRGLLARNPEISLRTPEATSLSRATSFNKKNVGDFYNNLKVVLEKHKFEPQNIYNCDETGCTTVQQCPKVIASKKSKQVGQATSAERGTLVTVCFAVNALGQVLPPFFVFPRVKYRDDMVHNGPDGSDGDAYPTGWMTTKCFLKFLGHFKKYSKSSKDNQVLLILDNHESHVSAQGIQFAKDNGITLLTLPPHCSNKLQPLDVAVYSSFKAKYNSRLSNWMLSNPGKTVTIYHIPGFVNDIMSDSFSRKNILSGFKKSGIHPYNPDTFTEDDFLCSAVTDRELPDTSNDDSSNNRAQRQIQIVFHEVQEIASSSTDNDDSLNNSAQRQIQDVLHEVQDIASNSQDILDDTNSTFASPASQRNETEDIGNMSPSLLLACEDSVNTNEVNLNVSPQEIKSLSLLALESLNGFPCTHTPSKPLPSRESETPEIMFPPQISETPDIITQPHVPNIVNKPIVTPEMVKPYPKAAPKKTNRGRKSGKTKILTKTPDKDAIEQEEATPKKVSKKRKKRQVNKKTEKAEKARKRIFQEENKKERENKVVPKKRKIQSKETTKKMVKKVRKAVKRSKRFSKYSTDNESESEPDIDVPYADSSDDNNWGVPELDNRWYCFICNTEDLMDMRICISCNRYVHEVCVGLTSKDTEDFICPDC